MVSSVVENIINDWSNESSCNSEIEENNAVLNTSKTKNYRDSNSESKRSSDDEGFSSSDATSCFDLNGGGSGKKVERENYRRTRSPHKNVVSRNEQNIIPTPTQSGTKKDKDKKFFENLLSIHNYSRTKIIIKDKFTVTEEVDATSTKTKSNTATNKINNKEKRVTLPRRKSERVKKLAARRWSTLYTADKKLYKAIIKPCDVTNVKKTKRKSMAAAAAAASKNQDGDTSSFINSSQNSVAGPRKRRKLYSEDHWLSNLHLENSTLQVI